MERPNSPAGLGASLLHTPGLRHPLPGLTPGALGPLGPTAASSGLAGTEWVPRSPGSQAYAPQFSPWSCLAPPHHSGTASLAGPRRERAPGARPWPRPSVLSCSCQVGDQGRSRCQGVKGTPKGSRPGWAGARLVSQSKQGRGRHRRLKKKKKKSGPPSSPPAPILQSLYSCSLLPSSSPQSLKLSGLGKRAGLGVGLLQRGAQHWSSGRKADFGRCPATPELASGVPTSEPHYQCEPQAADPFCPRRFSFHHLLR